jgi:hypothetical protein
MILEPIDNIDPQEWEEAISDYDFKYLFHRSIWLRFLEETQPGKILKFKIMNNGRVEGYLAGLLVRKGPLNIWGSPLPGTTTNYMGPIVNKHFNTEDFIKALDDFSRTHKIHHVELVSPFLNKDVMEGVGYTVFKDITYVVSLTPNEDLMWKKLKSECRNRIRKGINNGLTVEDTDDPTFVREYYNELLEVFGRQGLVPTYPIERVKSLFANLKPNNLLALQVKSKDIVVATGLFPYDDRCVYFFGGASWTKYQSLCPNELLHWTAMTIAAKIGIKEYDMTGGGTFKPKFGGIQLNVYGYHKSYTLLAKYGRSIYKSLFRVKQKIEGKIGRLSY